MNPRAPGLVFIAACIAALALHIVLPAGWMPVTTGKGIAISLCSGSPVPGDPVQPLGETEQPCAFAVALGPMLATATLLLPLLALPFLPPTHPVPQPGQLRRYRPRPPGQGPPAA